MTTKTRLYFDEDRRDAILALDSIAQGLGWCNVLPRIADDVPGIKVNFLGWTNHGNVQASFVTSPPRHGEAQTSSLGVLHSRGRLSRDRIRSMLRGAPFPIRQDHAQRGFLLIVPPTTSSSEVLEVMCSLTTELCDYEMTGGWRLEMYTRA
ncbi:MAG: hypothetical protein ACRDVC_01125 [Acidimicrobiales bacterium]